MNWQDRQVDYEKKCVGLLQQISPSKTTYEAKEEYGILIKKLNEKLNPSGHTAPKNNIMSIILEEIVRLNK